MDSRLHDSAPHCCYTLRTAAALPARRPLKSASLLAVMTASPSDCAAVSTKSLLVRLRSLPSEDSQSLLTAYTEALSLLTDDPESLSIFLDYVALARGLPACDPDELGCIFWFMKGKFRAHRPYWEGYIRFETFVRRKKFDDIFAKVMDWLRVKVFPEKEGVVRGLCAEREALRAGRASVRESGEVGGVNAANTANVVNTPGDGAVMGESDEYVSSEVSMSYITKKMRDMSSHTETLSVTLSAAEQLGAAQRRGAGAQQMLEPATEMERELDEHLHLHGRPRRGGAEGAGKENSTNRQEPQAAPLLVPQPKAVCELDILNITQRPGTGRFAGHPTKRAANMAAAAAASNPATAASLSSHTNTEPVKQHASQHEHQTSSTTAGKPNGNQIECALLEDTQTFKTVPQFIAFKGQELVRISRIGKGGYSLVYRVLYSEEIYALKQIRVEDEEGRAKCLEEVAILRKLENCAFVIRLVDYEITREHVNIIMEYGEVDLQRLITAGPLDMFFVKYIWKSILKILHFIYQNRIVHRDVKPANFVLVKGVLKLIDFGISKSIRADTTSVINIEKAGTMNYISPEQCVGGKVSRATDVWSAGCILYYMIYRKHIFVGKGIMDIIRYMGEERPIEYGEADPEAIKSIEMCLQYDSKKRAKPWELLQHAFLKD